MPSAVTLAGEISAHRSEEGQRRLRPRLFDTDWLVMSELKRAIESEARRIAAGSTALDFGCGSRPYASLFESRGCSYLGADLEGGDVEITADGCLALPPGSTDWLLSFQVLEHVRDLDLYLSEAHRVLRRDGTLLLSTHGTWLYHPHPADYRRWTRTGLQEDLETRGFKVLSCAAIVGPLAWTTLLRLTCFAASLRKIPMIGVALAGALAAMMNIRAWLEEKVTPRWVTNDNGCVYLVRARKIG